MTKVCVGIFSDKFYIKIIQFINTPIFHPLKKKDCENRSFAVVI